MFYLTYIFAWFKKKITEESTPRNDKLEIYTHKYSVNYNNWVISVLYMGDIQTDRKEFIPEVNLCPSSLILGQPEQNLLLDDIVENAKINKWIDIIEI